MPGASSGTFGAFLSLLVGIAVAMAAMSIGTLFAAADDGNTALAQNLQNVTTLNVWKLVNA